jgi:hypothetical protein
MEKALYNDNGNKLAWKELWVSAAILQAEEALRL